MSTKIVECSDGSKISLDTDLELSTKIGEGKTKVILEIAKFPKEVLIVSKDSITAGNGLKKDSLQGKGIFSTITTSNVFRLLELSKISTHFIAQATGESFRARKCKMIPLEVIVRRVAAGSILKRIPNLKMGERFETPMVEFTFKDDSQGDPLVTGFYFLKCNNNIEDEQVVNMKLVCGGITIDNVVLNQLKSLASRAFLVLEKAWSALQITLVDFKVEFGVTQENEIVIADVVDNDSWRIWLKGDPALMKDKQIYRNLPMGELSEKDRQALIDSYKWVAMESIKLIDSLIQKTEETKALVGVIMGSESDWETMKNATSTLQSLLVPFEVKIVSAHRTPERLFSYAKTAESRGIRVIIAGAGGAAHLPGMVSSLCSIPVLGVPIQSSALSGMDSLLSIVQMPGGIPVGTLAIGKAGAINAAILAAEILGTSGLFPEIKQAVKSFRKKQTESVAEVPKELQSVSQVVQTHSSFSTIITPVSKQIQNVFPLKKLPPGSTIGIIGGGQLAKMTVIAAANLGYKCHIYCPELDSPAFQVADDYTIGEYLDKTQLGLFASKVDVITYEFENIPIETTDYLSQFVAVRPKSEVLAICQNRIKEKTFINSAGVETTAFLEVSNATQLKEALQKLGLPSILKSNTMGYDGKGQAMINSIENLEEVFNKISKVSSDKLCILEAFVSVIVARGFTGETVTFPVVENTHKNHILKQTVAPANVSEDVRKQAEKAAVQIAEAIGLIGVLAVEMFVTKDGKVLVNELAPRPHNSGHWTIEGSKTSQFEQLVRSICGLPLGKTNIIGKKATMINLLGNEIHDWEKYLDQEGAHLHVYGKKEAREGRKMGHVTFLDV